MAPWNFSTTEIRHGEYVTGELSGSPEHPLKYLPDLASDEAAAVSGASISLHRRAALHALPWMNPGKPSSSYDGAAAQMIQDSRSAPYVFETTGPIGRSKYPAW